jgi:glycosyltransferase involved in cell wall biosynthesis
MFFPVPTSIAVETGLPFGLAVHDLQHRLQPHFYGRGSAGHWEALEYACRNAARRAAVIVAESPTGRDDLLDCYSAHGLTPDRIVVVPYTVPPYFQLDRLTEETARVRSRWGLGDRYLFYPAQFWTHKNHVRIIEALGLLKLRLRLRIPLVLVGDASGRNRRDVLRDVLLTARRAEVIDQLYYLGRVSDSDMIGLFGGATALVMPSFFGPTNLPILEAWAVGCPVITSDIRGIREMCGDAALLVDPGSPEPLASAILRLWTEPDTAAVLVSRGRARIAEFSPERFRAGLADALARLRA